MSPAVQQGRIQVKPILNKFTACGVQADDEVKRPKQYLPKFLNT